MQVALLQGMDHSFRLWHPDTTSVHLIEAAKNSIVPIPSKTANVNVSFKAVLPCLGRVRVAIYSALQEI